MNQNAAIAVNGAVTKTTPIGRPVGNVHTSASAVAPIPKINGRQACPTALDSMPTRRMAITVRSPKLNS